MKSLSIFFLLLPSVLFSQNKNIVDSLQNELTKAMQDTTKVLILKKLAWQYFHSDPAKSHHYVSRMIEVSEKKKFLKGIWDGYNIRGALYKSKTNYDSAIMWFNKALALSEDEKYNDARFYTLKYLGRSYLESADFEKSKYCFSTLLEAASSLGNKKEMARGHKGLAATYYKHGEYYQGLKHYLQADSILGDEISIDHGEILQNIGIVYHAIDNFKLEKEYYKRALSVYEKLNDSYGKNAIEYSLGRLEIENENYLKAERHLLTALTYFEQINEPRILGDIQHSLGKVYYFVEDYSRSIRHQQIAIDIVKRIEGSPSLNQSYRALGESYLALKDYQKAIRAFNKAYAHAIKIGEIQSISLILYSLSDLYSKTGDYEKAYEIQQEYQVLKDSLNEVKSSKAIYEIEAKYQDEKKLQQIKLLEAQNQLKEEEKSRHLFIFIVSIAALLLVISFLYFLFRSHQKANKKLKDLDSLKSRFFANISHEFRTPLTLISGPLEERLQRPGIDEKEKSDLEMVQRNSKQLLDLVDQLLDLSKLESGGYVLKIEQGDLSNVIKTIATPFKYAANQKDIDLNLAVPASPEKTWLDRDAAQKIIANLLSNALKYTPEGGSINLSVEYVDDRAIITCENSGEGIDKKDLDKIFDRFYQQKSAAGGVGIGLALIKELTDLLGGSISVESIPNLSTTFKVIFPVDAAAFDRVGIKAERDEIPGQAIELYHYSDDDADPEYQRDEKPILLLVDDNVEVRKFVKSILKNEYQIYEADDGREGIERALESIPDLIISDVMMPGTDGIELCRTLKFDERTSHIPIILLTAKAGDENELTGFETGADDYITKPFNGEILKVRIEKLIEIRKNLQRRFSQEIILKPTDISITPADEKFLNKVQQILDEHIGNCEFSAETFSREIGMSRMQLHRKLKALTGLSTNHFMRKQRINMAADLLSRSDINISEIGYMVGFNNPSYFAKCFKEYYGCTPSEYVSK